ncbi:dynein intermediate chain 2, ciliary [Rhynchophorus ferrugineus]|uniref:dynein intermediate chain 2, ciliary n=1 Tax=Rhynchophorus ferrugineus TaxID=354439 RepID=UPI003FCE4E51
MPSNKGARAPKIGRKTTKVSEAVDELEEWRKGKQLLKPKDQLELSEAELKEIIAKQLSTTNAQSPDNLVEFSYAQGAFMSMPPPGNTVVVYETIGTALHKDTEEAKFQLLEQGIDPSTYGVSDDEEEEEAKPEPPQKPAEGEAEGEAAEQDDENKEEEADDDVSRVEKPDDEGEGEGEGDAEPETKVETSKAPPKGGKPRKLTNQFNFCERAALTYNNPTRSQETQTVPPPMATFSANVLQWVIYDGYQKDFEAQQLEKELERERKEKEKAPVSKHQPQRKTPGRSQLSEAVQGRVLECWRVLERMINQNTYDDIAKDYRYWDDPSDEFREDEGTLLPLWKFTYDRTKKNTITDLEWNPYYYDLFAVCFGFLDFMKPTPEGAVCMFTLKNPSFPDYICMTESGVMCVDTHPRYPYMVVVGLYDGSVQVFNVYANCKEPAFRSNNVTNKHKGIIWEVKWAPDLPDGELNFFSVAADGKINNWVLMQNELSVTTIITLYLDKETVPGPDGTQLRVKGCASCVKLHPKNPLIYLVGTEEGQIYKCSTAYSSMFLLTYNAHQMPIARIDFNKYNTDIFISCSGDWRIKIWEDNRLEPLFVFDVGDRVGDVKWAPYSSTVFAAVTTEGKVYVFDLNVNKYKPICVQAIVSKRRNKLTRLSFNPKLPILIVGDDKGCVTTLKLSPNLRIPCKAPKKQQHLDQWTLQCMKLDKLLSLVREPVNLTLPEDTAESEDS